VISHEAKADMSAAVIVGDVADELDVDLVVLDSNLIHHHALDANLLAEFVPCPIMFMP